VGAIAPTAPYGSALDFSLRSQTISLIISVLNCIIISRQFPFQLNNFSTYIRKILLKPVSVHKHLYLLLLIFQKLNTFDELLATVNLTVYEQFNIYANLLLN